MGLLGLVFVVSVGMLRTEDHARLNRSDADRRAYMLDATNRLTRWYAYSSGTTGGSAGQIDMTAALAQAGVIPRYGLRAASSSRQTDGLVSWHVLALWLPEPTRVQGENLDTATGVFNQGTLISSGQPALLVHAVIDGHASQLAKFSESQRRLRIVASRLENMFSRLRDVDPYQTVGMNWYRASDCGDIKAGELPCYNTYTSLASTVVPMLAGSSPDTNVNAWGAAIEVSNLIDSSITSPFSMAVQTSLPWGGVLRVVAQEP